MGTTGSLPRTSLGTRGLCLTLALTFLVPPNLAFAQDRAPGGGGGGGLDAPTTGPLAEDLEVLDAIDVDPRTGGVLLTRTDLVVGEAEQAFRFTRTYRPWGGDQLNLGLSWATSLDLRLDVNAKGTRASFQDADGHRYFFARNRDGQLVSASGPEAVVRELEDGWALVGLGDGRSYRFDAKGFITDREGPTASRVHFRYDDQRRLTAVEGPWGKVEVERDKAGRLVLLRAPGEVVVRYQHDEQGNLNEVIRGGERERYRYDRGGRLLSVANDQALIGYDLLGRVVRLAGPGLRPLVVRYEQGRGEWPTGTTITRGDRSETFRYSADGRRVERTDADGGVTLTELDGRDRVVHVVAPDGRELRRSYDEAGRLSTQTTPQGTVRYHYESKVSERPTRIQLADGREARFRYDVRGNVLEYAAPGGGTTRYAYDAAGRLQKLTDPRGAVTTFSRDARGYVLEIEEEGVGTTSFLRDEAGRLLKVKRPDGRVVTLSRELNGRSFKIQDALGVVQQVSFDARRRVTRLIDEEGHDYAYDYAPTGELLKVTDHGQPHLGFAYDAAGEVSRVVDALGNSTSIERQGPGKVTITDPSGGARTVERDPAGRLLRETRGDVTIRYGYDQRGQLLTRETPRGTERFQFDEHGRLLGLEGPDGGYALAYDDLGRLSSLTDTGLKQTIRYAYDAAGDRTSMKLPWGEVRYRHDVQGRLTGLVLPDGKEVAIELNRDGRRKAIRYPNGTESRFYYERGRLQAVITRKGEQELDRRVYTYDERGRLASSEDHQRRRTTYRHDERGRVIEATGPAGTTRYAYDAAGNRTVVETAQGKQQVETGAGNRVLRQGEARFTYTKTGAIETRTDAQGTTRYAYDQDDRLVAVTAPGGKTVRYGYAPNGTRLWRAEEGGQKVHFLYDLSDVVGELTPEGKLLTGYVHGQGEDDVLAAQRDGQEFFYHYDLVRSVTALTGEDGAVAARYAYDPFGQQLQASGAAAAWNPHRFTSRTLDAATGLYDYRARSYAPELGRFTSPDPVGMAGGANLYAYVGNDPLRFNDPAGLWPDWLDRAAESTVNWVGRNVVDPVASAASWTHENVLKPVGSALAYTGRQTWAFGRGFVKGTWGAVKGIYTMVRHPIETFNAIYGAIENWDETKEALLAKWEEYKDAAVNDPEKFAEMTGYLTAEIVLSVAGTKGLDKLAKAGTVARLGNNAARVAEIASNPITRTAARAGGVLERNLPRVAKVVREGRVLNRARNIELARRAAAETSWLTKIPRRIGYVGRDLWSGTRLAATKPGAFAVYSGMRLSRAGGALVLATGRGIWKAGKVGTIPALGVFDDQITDAIGAYENREAAVADVAKRADRFLADAGSLSPDDMAKRLAELGGVYDTYRNRLMAPVHEEDQRLDAALKELDAKVAAGEIPDNTIDSRLNALLEEYGRRRHNILTDIYDRNREASHDMSHPSINRTVAFQDEIDLLEAAKKKVTDPTALALLEARQKDLQERMAYEYDLFRRGDHDVLIAGVAGPPRAPEGEGLPAPSTPADLDGMDFNPGMLDKLDDFQDAPGR
ncbi:MAG: RHS repeat-associated core domain-containing protein [Planctomycetota bacterium]